MLHAMLVVHRVCDGAAGVQFIDFLCVHPHSRRCGYARQIIEHIDGPAELLVQDRNNAAIRLYAKSEFVPSGRSFYEPAIGQTTWRRNRSGLVNAANRIEFRPWNEIDAARRLELREMARACGFSTDIVLMESDDRVRVAVL